MKVKDKIFEDEELYQIPKSPKLFEVYLEDKYIVTENEAKTETWRENYNKKLKDNNYFCPAKAVLQRNKCWCEAFRMQDAEGPCKCGLYVKTLRDDESFKKMRNASLNRTIL